MTTGRLAPQERLDDAAGPDDGEHAARVKKLLRVMRKQIWIGTFVGFIIALCIGTAFIVVVSNQSCRVKRSSRLTA